MANRSIGGDKVIDRRIVLRAGAALAAAGPVLLRGVTAEAQPRPPGTSGIGLARSVDHLLCYSR